METETEAEIDLDDGLWFYYGIDYTVLGAIDRHHFRNAMGFDLVPIYDSIHLLVGCYRYAGAITSVLKEHSSQQAV